MKSGLVPVFAPLFSLLKNKWNVEKYWLVVYDMTENLMISTQEKNTCKNERV